MKLADELHNFLKLKKARFDFEYLVLLTVESPGFLMGREMRDSRFESGISNTPHLRAKTREVVFLFQPNRRLSSSIVKIRRFSVVATCLSNAAIRLSG